MPAPDQNAVLKALREGIDFVRRMGMEQEASELEQFHTRFQTEKPTLKTLRCDLEPSRSAISSKIKKMLNKDYRTPYPGMEKLAQERGRIFLAIENVIYPRPPQPATLDISGANGSESIKDKVVPYFGDAEQVHRIVERTIELIQCYTRLIGDGKFDEAYLLTATGLQAWMSKKRFMTDHERAARNYHGPALDYLIDSFQYIYADDAARKKSKADEGWPKTTSKEERRSSVIGFWIRDRADSAGCWGGFLVSEEKCEYRIANFTFFVQ